jgi:arylsulfatase A-like enzyme
MAYGARIIWLCSFAALAANATGSSGATRPNVVVIITDDQGYGDVGFHGNPRIQTPHLDRLARESTRVEHFYVSPVCAPTRASLMTGRYAYRTGVVDTFLGRAMMHPDEVTLAEMLAAAGYRTGIFGKWHLGDNYPLRSMDQGFQESLVLRGGGIGQPSDPPVPGGGQYMDPVLQHNGRQTRTKGYCTDVFTDAAIEFIAQTRDRPFFVYLAYNAPHAPLQVPESDDLPYKSMDLSPAGFPKIGQPISPRTDPDVTARIYGMVTRIDANLGRLFAKLDALSLTNETIVVFLTDNGPQQPRYNSGMRDRKGSVYEGGIRVPCFIRWPGRFAAGRVVDRIAGAFDIAPTLLDACGVQKPAGVVFDGRSLLPLLRGEAVDWPDRTLFLQWHRGDVPQRFRAFAARSERYKLVRPESSTAKPVEQSLELYDVQNDPFEFHDLSAQNPEVVARLRKSYEAWFDDVERTRHFAPPQIVLGSAHEDPSTLTRQDWRGPRARWDDEALGYWEVAVARSGRFDITLRFSPRASPAQAHFALGNAAAAVDVKPGATECRLESIELADGPGRLEAWLSLGAKSVGVSYVELGRAR